MKKLMIAAAAAAMIGGVQAATGVRAEYDFVAYLTTTAAAQGSEVLTPYSAFFGVSDANVMYYMDPELRRYSVDFGTPGDPGFVKREWNEAGTNRFPHLTWVTVRSSAGRPFPTLHVVNETATNLPIVNDVESELLSRLGRVYNNTSYGYWCGYAEWYTRVDAMCFRVTSGETIVTKVYLNSTNCCNRSGNWTRAFTADRAGTTKVISYGNIAGWTAGTDSTTGWFNNPGTTVNGMLNTFGAQNAENAIYLETYARVDNVRTYNNRLPFQGWLAGQGNVYSVGETTIFIPWTISGAIVGTTKAPECVDCCVRPLPQAIAFDCFDQGGDVGTPTNRRDTAAFGTFYLQVYDAEAYQY